MNSKVQIWCPFCHKRYSIPKNLPQRKLRCKKCDNSFPTQDALRSDPKEIAETPVLNPAVSTPATFDKPVDPTSERQPSLEKKLSSNYDRSPVSEVAQEVASAIVPETRKGPRSRLSPLLISAVISLVLFSMLIVGLTFFQDPSPPADTSAANVSESSSKPTVDDVAESNNSSNNSAQPKEFTREQVPDRKTEQNEQTLQSETNELVNNQPIQSQAYEAEKLAQERTTPPVDQPVERPTDNLLMRIPVSSQGVKSLVLTERFLFTGGYEAIRVYDWTTKTELFHLPDLSEQFGKVTTLALSPDYTQLAAGGDNGTIVVFKVDADGQLSDPKEMPNEAPNDITQLLFDETGTRLISADNKLRIYLWNLENAQPLMQLSLAKAQCKEATLTTLGPEEKSFRVATCEDTLDFLLENGKPQKRRNAKILGYPRALQFSPSRKLLAFADANRIKIRGDASNKLSELKSDNGVNWSLKFIDENTLLAGTRSEVARWDLRSNQISRRYKIPDALSIKLMAISTDGKQIAVCSASARQDVFVIDVSDP